MTCPLGTHLLTEPCAFCDESDAVKQREIMRKRTVTIKTPPDKLW